MSKKKVSRIYDHIRKWNNDLQIVGIVVSTRGGGGELDGREGVAVPLIGVALTRPHILTWKDISIGKEFMLSVYN